VESSLADELDQAQERLLATWKEKQLVSRRLLAYDTTNFYTWVASTNRRNGLAQRGHNKQGRHSLRQVGLSYVLDGENGLSFCHHVYAGNVADAAEFPEALARIVRMLDHNQIERQSVTLVFDKGTAALDNTLRLEQAGVGWISALPRNQAPAELRARAVEALPLCSSDQPGVRAAAEKAIVHGKEYWCVLKYSSSFAGEQLHSVTTDQQDPTIVAAVVDGGGQAGVPFERKPDPPQNRALAVEAFLGGFDSVAAGCPGRTLAAAV
jgi:transposase